MRHATILVAILAFVPLASATAQVPVRPGARVRVTGPPICPPTYILCVGGPRLQSVGTFVTWEADSLIMESNGNVLALPLDSVTKLEVSWGRKTNTGMGAGIGFLVGGLVGATIGYASYEECSCLGGGVGPETLALVGAVIGGFGGLVTGALIGLEIETDRWEEVPLDQLRVSFVPQRDGKFGFGASVRF